MDTDDQLIVLDKQEAWCGVNQQDPENLHIKEEQEDLRTSLEGEQLNLKKTDAARFLFSSVSIKSEDDEEKPLFSQLQKQKIDDRDVPTSSSADQMTAETDGGAETSRNPDVNPHEQISDSSETEVSGDDEEDDDVNLDSRRSVPGPETGDRDNDWNESRSSESDVKAINKSCSCSECGEQFLHKSSLQKHVRVTGHSAIRSPGCLVNKEYVGVKKQVDSCKKVQKELKSLSCDYCGKGFSYKSTLNIHLRVHTGEKPFACHFCSRRFGSKEYLKVHMRVHIEPKPFSCKLSGQRFAQKELLTSRKKCVGVKQQVDSCKKVQKKLKLSCDFCGKGFSCQSALNIHIRVHTGEKPFDCNFCSQRFKYKGQLKLHIRVHLKKKPLACKICKKKFKLKSRLKSHMIVHKGEKPFSCELCGKKFGYKSGLANHMSIHTGQRPFACELCGKRFRLKASLTCHMSVHTGQKPFACELCGQRFSRKPHLGSHMRTHTGEKPYACGLCGRQFGYKVGLNNHMRVHTDRSLLPVSSVDRDLASKESTQSSGLTNGRVGGKLGELCSDPLKHTEYLILQPLNTSAEMGKMTNKPTQASGEPNKEDNSQGNQTSQTTCAANIPAAPLTRADMEVMLQGLEDRITSKLSAQLTVNRALLEQHNLSLQQLETSMNNMNNRMLELKTTCSMLMQKKKQSKN